MVALFTFQRNPKSFLWSFCGTHLERSSFSRVKVPLGFGALKFQVGLRIFPRNPRVDFEVLGSILAAILFPRVKVPLDFGALTC